MLHSELNFATLKSCESLVALNMGVIPSKVPPWKRENWEPWFWPRPDHVVWSGRQPASSSSPRVSVLLEPPKIHFQAPVIDIASAEGRRKTIVGVSDQTEFHASSSAGPRIRPTFHHAVLGIAVDRIWRGWTLWPFLLLMLLPRWRWGGTQHGWPFRNPHQQPVWATNPSDFPALSRCVRCCSSEPHVTVVSLKMLPSMKMCGVCHCGQTTVNRSEVSL